MIFVLDNYDSFTYNLVQYMGEMGAEMVIRRNDDVTVDEIIAMAPERIVLSPGPCTPREAGVMVSLIEELAERNSRVPVLGVCLGHQGMGEAFGGKIVRAEKVMHGKTSNVMHDGAGVFEGIDSPMTCTRYHSLIVEEKSLPKSLAVTARSEDGTIMGLRHRELPMEGVQFHPESILTENGKRLIANFLKM